MIELWIQIPPPHVWTQSSYLINTTSKINHNPFYVMVLVCDIWLWWICPSRQRLYLSSHPAKKSAQKIFDSLQNHNNIIECPIGGSKIRHTNTDATKWCTQGGSCNIASIQNIMHSRTENQNLNAISYCSVTQKVGDILSLVSCLY